MIDLTPKQQYPIFYPTTKEGWEALNSQADELLGFASAGADTYSSPIIDKFGAYWFLVQPETQSLVDLSKCKEYSEIQLPEIQRP